MKKFYKRTGIAVGICFFMGLVCAVVGAIMGAKGLLAFTSDFEFKIIDDMDKVSHKNRDIEPFEKIIVEVDNANINIISTTDGKYGVEYNLIDDGSNVKFLNEGGELVIKNHSSSNNFFLGFFTFGKSLLDYNEVTIYVPEFVTLSSVNIECDAGSIHVEDIKGVENLKIEADASDVDVKKGVYGTIDISVNAGDVSIENVDVNTLMRSYMNVGDLDIAGRIDGDIYIEVDMGDIDIETGYELSQYEYDISSSLGSMDVYGIDEDGINGELKGNKDGKYSMHINVDVGDISVNQ